ncbi:serine protease subtilisin family [Firmicutes bacterium CAG:137]|nr:serine protease subtilisin family [Firmicutes bacterium CAG:137]
MRKTGTANRLLAAVLTLALLLSLALPAGAAAAADVVHPAFTQVDSSEVSASLPGMEATELEPSAYSDTDSVRVSIVLEEKSTVAAGFSTQAIGSNTAAATYRGRLETRQAAVTAAIEEQALDGEALDVVWNLTLSANAISANVAYGKLEEIRQVPGVKAVYLETRYEPMTQADTSNVVAQQMTGAASVQQDAGYTGAGSRIAVVDTGTDTDHQSFSSAAWEYSLKLQAEKKGMSLEDYMASLDLMDAEEIAGVLSQLHVAKRDENLTGEDLYLNGKLPFVFNYIDGDLDVTHDNDEQGEHGSHVAGITSAGDYIPTKDASIYDFDGDGDLDQADAQALMDHVVKGSEIHSAEYADLSGNGSVSAYDVLLRL